MNARLAPTQYALVQQIQSACDQSQIRGRLSLRAKSAVASRHRDHPRRPEGPPRDLPRLLEDVQGRRLHRGRGAPGSAALDGRRSRYAARPTSTASACRTSTSTSRPPTRSCVTTAYRSASRTTSASAPGRSSASNVAHTAREARGRSTGSRLAAVSVATGVSSLVTRSYADPARSPWALSSASRRRILREVRPFDKARPGRPTMNDRVSITHRARRRRRPPESPREDERPRSRHVQGHRRRRRHARRGARTSASWCSRARAAPLRRARHGELHGARGGDTGDGIATSRTARTAPPTSSSTSRGSGGSCRCR